MPSMKTYEYRKIDAFTSENSLDTSPLPNRRFGPRMVAARVTPHGHKERLPGRQ